MSGHTPGPWLALPTVAPRGWNIEARGCTYTVAIARDGTGAPENEANAHLIAAAPELLAACRKLVEWNGNRAGFAEDLLPADQQVEWVADAMRAIAKATGEQP